MEKGNMDNKTGTIVGSKYRLYLQVSFNLTECQERKEGAGKGAEGRLYDQYFRLYYR